MVRSWQLGIYEKALPSTLSWEEKLRAAGGLGFDFVEISIDETDEKLARLDMSQQERKELVEAMASTGVPIRTMCLSGHRKYPLGSANPTTEARSLEIMDKALQLAVDLGIRIIQIAGYDVYYEESTEKTVARFEKNLQKAVDMAAAYGVLLGFETMETAFMNSVTKAMTYVRKVNSPYLHVYPDLGNVTNAMVASGGSVLQDLSNGEGSLVAMHLKETKPGVFRDMDFGAGHVDFSEGITGAWCQGVRRFTLECWYHGEQDWMERLAAARNRFAQELDSQIKKEF